MAMASVSYNKKFNYELPTISSKELWTTNEPYVLEIDKYKKPSYANIKLKN